VLTVPAKVNSAVDGDWVVREAVQVAAGLSVEQVVADRAAVVLGVDEET